MKNNFPRTNYLYKLWNKYIIFLYYPLLELNNRFLCLLENRLYWRCHKSKIYNFQYYHNKLCIARSINHRSFLELLSLRFWLNRPAYSIWVYILNNNNGAKIMNQKRGYAGIKDVIFNQILINELTEIMFPCRVRFCIFATVKCPAMTIWICPCYVTTAA